jgi:DNA-binding beta-propeller fold protein YncE
MAVRSGRVAVLTTAFLLVACGTQALAPRESTPIASPSVSPPGTNASNDVVHLRMPGSAGTGSIVAIDARTGTKLREIQDGVFSADASRLYWAESVSGATQTVVHTTEFATGKELRSFTIDAGYHTVYADNAPAGLSSDGRLLVVWGGEPYKLNGDWITRFGVVDLREGTLVSRVELGGQSTFGYTGIAPDGSKLYLTQFGEGTIRQRVFDLRANTLLPDVALGIEKDLRALGFRGSPLASADGRRIFTLNSIQGATSTFVLGLDVATGRAFRVVLPDQHTTDWEKELLWSLALSPDGRALYALNPALGVVNEIDVEREAVRRTGRLAMQADRPPALAQLFFPIAEAKRYLRTGALVSPDGRAIYVIGDKGLLVIDTATLAVRDSWSPDEMFGSLALSPDGARLYAIQAEANIIAIIDARIGKSLGALRTPNWVQSIVRIETRG